MQTTLSDNGGCSCKYTPWGCLAHLRSSSGPDRWQEWSPNGVGTWRHHYRWGGCHAKLPRLPLHSGGIALPQTLSSEGSTKHEFSSKRSTFSHKNTPPLHWGIQTAGPGGPFWSLDIMIEATVVVNIKVKLSSSVASSVWDSRKLEIIVGFLRAVFSERGPQHAAIWPADLWTPPDCWNSGCGGQHSVF